MRRHKFRGAQVAITVILAFGVLQSAACSQRSPAGSTPPIGSVTPNTHRGQNAILHQVDGGARYYAKFSPSLPTNPSFFPVGVFLAAVNNKAEIASDQAAGLNTYVTLTTNSNFSLVGSSGMYLISNRPSAGGKETVGWYVNDEADMWAGPGNAVWTGKSPTKPHAKGATCEPASAACGYTTQQDVIKALPRDHRFKYANYGKGVTFWETDAQAAQFVNDYQNVVSADNYWFTDDSICLASEGGRWFSPTLLLNGALPAPLCHLAANYAKTVERIRYLASDSKPVWAYVELGHPYAPKSWPSIEPPQIRAAVWQSLIAGARGIVYFSHSFGGPCITDNVLRALCYSKIRAAVTALDGEIKSLAPVLNSPFADNVVTASPGVNLSTKWYRGHFYILAGSSGLASEVITFSMPCVGSSTVKVLDENRSIRAPGGIFRDRFADSNAVHIYRVDGGSSCGA
jgi:hypothetical protein